jgi:serine/threonine protein kinase
MSKLVGHVIAGRYRVDEFLGRGAMAEVYKVWDQQRATWLAMKVLHESLAEDNVFLRRFRREAANLAKLRHPNIVRFYEWGEADELVFMLMEYVPGITLSKAIKRSGKPFSPRQALGILQPVCAALHYAHEQGLAHCDIKPGNIMLDESGRVYLADFGIARVTEGSATATMVGAGTPAYMSPEQVNGADPTPQTDLYSIGVVLFELLTGGERPFTGERATITGTAGEKIRWEKRKLPAPSPRQYNPEIIPEIEAVVMRCLAKDRRSRYDTVNIFLDDFVRAVGESTEALPPAVFVDKSVQLKKPAKRNWAYLAAGLAGLACLFMLILGGAGIFIFNIPIGLGLQPTLPQPSAVVVTTVVEKVVPVEVTPIPPTNPPEPTRRPPTNTPRPTSIPVQSLSVDIVTEGGARYIQVSGGIEDYDGRFGPVAEGELILGPNDVFCVYVDILGNIYVLRYGTTLRTLVNIRQELAALRTGTQPDYDLDLYLDNNGTYTLYIYERNHGDNYAIKLPRNLTLE